MTLNVLERSNGGRRFVATVLTLLFLSLVVVGPAQGGEMHTGLRAAAIKKCKQKFPPGPRRDTCLKKAKFEPQ